MSSRTPAARRRDTTRFRRSIAAAAAGVLLTSVAACSTATGTTAEGATATDTAPADVLRLGYFANVTHAPALVGVAGGTIADELGDTELETQVFNAGPSAIEALNAGAIDATFIGPNPAINGFVQSQGEALKIVAGVTHGGAQLVVKPDIDGPEDLRGANLASPQLGGTQDVALRAWLEDNGLETSISGGGDVTITPTENPQTLQLFQDRRLDGAWLPEPWASRLVVEAGAEVLVDERDLWENGEFLTTHLIVSTSFLNEHPETVEALVRGTVESIEWIEEHPDEAPALVNQEIEAETSKALPDAVLSRAFEGITFSWDPLAGTLEELLADGVAVGTTHEASLDGIYDLRILNNVLADRGEDPVSAAGLGQE
jgi:NitT/TauT family transport system substrate-binding protein